MSIEELQKAFLDLDFQANRIAKLKEVDPEHLSRYNEDQIQPKEDLPIEVETALTLLWVFLFW